VRRADGIVADQRRRGERPEIVDRVAAVRSEDQYSPVDVFSASTMNSVYGFDPETESESVAAL
jgi:hypothetical protein